MAPRFILPAILLAVCAIAGSAAAQEELTGMYRLSRTSTAIVGADIAGVLKEAIGEDEELQWQVYVPESYSPDRPAGIFVYVDPNGAGYIPEQWQPVFSAHNMIWVGVKRTQRKLTELRRSWQAILGSRAIAQDYTIDPQRIYVGAALDTVPAALNTMLIANEFSGAVYIRGSYNPLKLDPEYLQALQRKSHVFITGTNDQDKTEIRSNYERYRKNGIEHTKLIFDMQRLEDIPKPEQIDEALGFLEASMPAPHP